MDPYISYRIIRSSRKTIAIQITPSGEVLVRCPHRISTEDIQKFVADKSVWIRGHLDRLPKQAAPALRAEDIRALTRDALAVIPERVAFFAPLVGVSYGRVTVRHQRTRWGSCNGHGDLSFNCLLMLAPPEALDYVVVHELSHRLEMNHSPRFWAQVERVMPNYRIWRKWLKDNGSALISRLP